MLKVGIVGLPNVGKSTLFNAVLKREQALSANYPFATIEPNVGVVDVVDKRLNKLAEIIDKNTGVNPPIVYANIEFVDIAGLVEGANKGEGLGNKFLANIREVDMILQVVRDFSDTNIIREHSKNPETDTDVINNELILKDIESIEKQIKSIGRDDKKQSELNVYNLYLTELNKGILAVEIKQKVSEEHYQEFIKPLFLLTDKPVIYVFNTDETDDRLNKDGDTFKQRQVIYICAKLESELASLSSEDQKAYLADLGINENGLDKITNACFKMLGLISYFTAGEKEVRAWEVTNGSNAAKAAGKIHTDFEKNFIKAEVVAFNDYVEFGGRVGAKDKGKLRLEGKEYIVKDGDVIEFKIGSK
jgi:hypothetical protein